MAEDDILDVAIVGAGVSGVYAAWRLRTDPPPGKPVPSVQVFESSDRIGGRLLSVQAPGVPGIYCELGGMRYMNSQPLITSLVERKLKLPVHVLEVFRPENINYMRGQRFRNSDLAAGVPIPFDLSWSERGLAVDTLLSHVLNALIPGVTNMPVEQLREFLKDYKVDGRSIVDWGFWNLVAAGMSHEAYELARIAGGYDTPLLNWNAYDTIVLNFDFQPGVQFHALDGGYQSVPLKLRDLFTEAGGTVNPGHRLEAFTVDSDGLVELRVSGPEGANVVRARSLILAMPRRSLELIEASGPVLDAANTAVRRLIESVTPIPLFKTFVAYDFPWWENVGVTTGRTTTDLPIRQVYYWGTAAKARGGDPANRKAVVLASYDDSLSVDFWAGYLDDDSLPVFEQRDDALTEQHPGSERWKRYRAPAPLVREIDRQLKEIHDVRHTPTPYAAAYKDWGEDPYGGGVNFWNIHARSYEVIPKIAQPVPSLPVYVCGEAYSNGQGWVEGALETTELVLQNHFGLEAPEWVA